jgi:DNA-binding CsgD family transcriptional regulator
MLEGRGMLVRADYVRNLLRLLGESRELVASGERPYAHFLGGLARIACAQVAIKMTACGIRIGSKPIITEVYDSGWATHSDRDRVYSYVTTTPLESDPLCAAVMASGDPQVTVARCDVIDDSAWRETQVRNDVHRPSGIEDAVLSLRRRSGDTADVLVLKRAWGERPFGPDERELVDLVQSECGWLFEATPSSDDDPPQRLTRRERDTLKLLLTGQSEKGIASSLGLSPHTVHDYVKVIYRKLGVGSRAELMASALTKRLGA